MGKPIYLDHHATTPVDPEVFKAMEPYFSLAFGNPSSRGHSYGWEAEAAVEQAREQVAALIKADAKEIIFTGGGTEANNLAVLGLVQKSADLRHIMTSVVEHKSLLGAAERAAELGAEVSLLPVDHFGQVHVQQVSDHLKSTTVLVSLLLANNEVGTINPIEDVGALCRHKEVLFHSDAVQALGRMKIDVRELNVDLMTISAHKIYGPKGVGALFVRRRAPRIKLTPIVHGGGQELGLRGGTLNVPAIVGFGKACELAAARLDEDRRKMTALRDRFINHVQAKLPEASLNGNPDSRLCNNASFTFAGVPSSELVKRLSPFVAVSSGSACTTGSVEASHVLKAIGLSEELAKSTLRFGLGRTNTEEEIDLAAEKLIEAFRTGREEHLRFEHSLQGVET